MNLTLQGQDIYNQIDPNVTKLGDLRKMAKAIKKDHNLAMELWSTQEVLPCQLAILIMDKKLLDKTVVDQLLGDIKQHEMEDRLLLADWLMANQLMKDKKLIALIYTWEDHAHPLQRRIFWYYQARLRWTGQIPPYNTESLLQSIEKNMATEVPEVQWAMNFTAGQIGVFDATHRERCISIGTYTGLYKDEVVPRGCTPSYLPEFIPIQVGKMKK